MSFKSFDDYIIARMRMIQKKLALFFALFSFVSTTVNAYEEVTADSAIAKPKRNDIIRFADASIHTLISPVRWKGKDWLKMGGVVGGTALLTLVDKPVRSFWQKRDSKVWDGVERAGFHYGKPYAAFIMTGGFYLTGVVIKNEWARETGLMLAAAYLTGGAVQTFMKTAVGRARPGTGVGPWRFDPFSPDPGYHSFPSGHIQIATISAVILAHRVESPVLKAAFYGTAGVTLVSRMYSDAHWLSDMAFGGAISWFCAQSVIKRMEQNKNTNLFRRKDKITWNFSPSMQGFTLTGNF